MNPLRETWTGDIQGGYVKSSPNVFDSRMRCLACELEPCDVPIIAAAPSLFRDAEWLLGTLESKALTFEEYTRIEEIRSRLDRIRKETQSA